MQQKDREQDALFGGTQPNRQVAIGANLKRAEHTKPHHSLPPDPSVAKVLVPFMSSRACTGP